VHPAVGHAFLGAMCTNDVQVCGLGASWEGIDRDEKHCVGAQCFLGSLHEPVDFHCVGGLPVYAVGTATECTIFCKLTSIQIKCIAM